MISGVPAFSFPGLPFPSSGQFSLRGSHFNKQHTAVPRRGRQQDSIRESELFLAGFRHNSFRGHCTRAATVRAGVDSIDTDTEDTEEDTRSAEGASSSTNNNGAPEKNGTTSRNVTGPEGPVTRVTADGRIVAIGDLHGDLTKTLQSLELAGVLGRDGTGRPIWVGGNTVVVQLGDVMDRGDCEIGIVMLLRQLHKMAKKDGGAVYMLNGNHESLNICGDYRYVTAGAFLEAAMAAGLKGEQAENWENQLRARVRLYSPGGPMALELSKNPTVLVVNDTAFAHGGLLPEHASYGLERMNRDVAKWMRGEKTDDGSPFPPPFLAMGDSSSVMWNRMYSRERFPNPYEKFHTCNTLKETLEQIGAKRLVVGHTPQMEGANCECEQQIWRVDVGMSGGVLDAAAEILEITTDGSATVCKILSAATVKVATKGRS